jgi:hypothetical protein
LPGGSRGLGDVYKRQVTAATQLENGKITVTDYLTQLNAEMQATLNQKIHEVKLMNAMTSYNTTRGVNQF